MATTEVAEALESLDFVQEVNVYGVTVPGAKTREVEGSRPATLDWYYLGTGNMRPESGSPQQLAFPPTPPGHEGRAGMAALVLRPPHSLDLEQLYSHVSENLPPYAWPRFLRLQVIESSCSHLSAPAPAAASGFQTPRGGPCAAPSLAGKNSSFLDVHSVRHSCPLPGLAPSL